MDNSEENKGQEAEDKDGGEEEEKEEGEEKGDKEKSEKEEKKEDTEPTAGNEDLRNEVVMELCALVSKQLIPWMEAMSNCIHVYVFHIELHYEPITSESWDRVVGP